MCMLYVAWVAVFIPAIYALDNGLGITPPMGWSSWNHFACNVTDEIIRAQARAMVDSGLKEVGFEYVNIDDCWMAKERDYNGLLTYDPVKFPNGILALGNYVRSLGLKFGLYESSGGMSCQKYAGTLSKDCGHWPNQACKDFVFRDAKTMADMGMDYLKLDNCFATPPWWPVREPQNVTWREPRFELMREALNATGRSVFYSICAPWTKVDNTSYWAGPVGNSWRTGWDIQPHWNSVIGEAVHQDPWAKFAGPGHWNDPDMLQIGNEGLNDIEGFTQFAVWSWIKAPLILGNDLSSMSNATLETIRNQELIAVNQDPLGIQGTLVQNGRTQQKIVHRDHRGIFETWISNEEQIWQVELSNNRKGVLLVNAGRAVMDITFSFKQVGWDGDIAHIRELQHGKDLGVFSRQYTAVDVPVHGCVPLILADHGHEQTRSKQM